MGRPGSGRTPSDLGDRDADQVRVGHRGEIDEPDAVVERRHGLAGDLQGQAGLARAAGADDGDQPVVARRLRSSSRSSVTADEARRRGGQVVRRRGERAGAGEVALQPVGDELEEPLAAVEAPQLVEAKIERARRRRAGRRPGAPSRRSRAPGRRGRPTATRAARWTSGVAYSPAGGSAKPECRPIRTRGRAWACGQSWLASACCASAQARSAALASGKAAKTESPSVNSATPSPAPRARRRICRCSASTGR